MNDHADGFTQAAFSLCPGCHAHCFPDFFPALTQRAGRAFSSRESQLASRQENGPDSAIENESRRKPKIRSG
jgi:hypothetical protein